MHMTRTWYATRPKAQGQRSPLQHCTTSTMLTLCAPFVQCVYSMVLGAGAVGFNTLAVLCVLHISTLTINVSLFCCGPNISFTAYSVLLKIWNNYTLYFLNEKEICNYELVFKPLFKNWAKEICWIFSSFLSLPHPGFGASASSLLCEE